MRFQNCAKVIDSLCDCVEDSMYNFNRDGQAGPEYLAHIIKFMISRATSLLACRRVITTAASEQN